MSMTKIPHRLYLTEEQMPKQWFNLRAAMPQQPDPLLNPATLQPLDTADLAPIFCEELARQELDGATPYVDIPEPVQEVYKMYRPSPLIRAYALEKALATPARIYYKFEGNNTSGSHKLNSAVAQAYYAKQQGLTGVTTETGAGQWGTALSEAVEAALASGGTKRYVLGSVLNQVVLHQSIIGLETKLAMEQLDEYPDVVVGCAGGGSNLGGLIAPFMADKLQGRSHTRFVAVEPASCPSLTRGRYAYDFCDTGHVTPLARMYTLGSGFIPSANHAGGLRYHGMSPILSKLYHDGYMEAVAYEQSRVFEAAVFFAKHETILPAPESAHAIRGAMDEALKCKQTGEAKTILFGLTGTGYFDMTAYESYLSGRMTDTIPTDEDLQRGFDSLPAIPQNRM